MAYKTDQHRLVHRGRSFHFVSYEGLLANANKEQVATPPTWYLMSGGKRWAVMPQVPDQQPTDLDEQLGRWLDEHVFTGIPA